jgi:hypothetical protein
MLKKFLREPLLHFLLLGAAIFAAYSFVSKRSSAEPGKIVITQGQVESLATGFARTWQRPPTDQELTGLLRDRVREEVYYREALALGLDKDDTVIRRRLRQKMEFVSDDLAAQAEPTDADLNAYLQAHADKFPVEQRFTFRQVYLNPDKHRATLAGDSARLLAQLKQSGDNADVSTLGDTFLLEHHFTALPASEIAKQFGEQFAAKLPELPPGQWQGPIESGYGVHLVKVTERSEGRLPALADVRQVVRRESDNARRQKANEQFFQELLKRYVVTIEQPKLASDQTRLTKTE